MGWWNFAEALTTMSLESGIYIWEKPWKWDHGGLGIWEMSGQDAIVPVSLW